MATLGAEHRTRERDQAGNQRRPAMLVTDSELTRPASPSSALMRTSQLESWVLRLKIIEPLLENICLGVPAFGSNSGGNQMRKTHAPMEGEPVPRA